MYTLLHRFVGWTQTEILTISTKSQQGQDSIESHNNPMPGSGSSADIDMEMEAEQILWGGEYPLQCWGGYTRRSTLDEVIVPRLPFCLSLSLCVCVCFNVAYRLTKSPQTRGGGSPHEHGKRPVHQPRPNEIAAMTMRGCTHTHTLGPRVNEETNPQRNSQQDQDRNSVMYPSPWKEHGEARLEQYPRDSWSCLASNNEQASK